jgi:parvulin-like peptidyl-prolyl isomerase
MQKLWRERTYNDLIRRQVSESVTYDIAQTKTLIHAAHILVATKEEADAALDRIAAGEDFETLAAELSLDTSNSYKGGDLGWFGSGQMVADFENAAFAVPVGEISPPVQTQFGWHLIKVYDKVDEPTNVFDQETQRQSELTAMIAQWRSEETVVIDDTYPNYAPTLPQLQGQ